MALDSTNLARLQASLGIGTDQSVFTDAELADIWSWASDDFAQAMVYSILQLMGNAAKMADYTAGETSEKRSQVFSQLKELLEWWQGEASSTPQIAFAGTSVAPPVNRSRPSDIPAKKTFKVEDI